MTTTQIQKITTAFEKPVLIAALLVIPTIIIEQSNPNATLSTIAAVLNWLIWTVFAIEAITLFSITPNKKQWVIKHPLEIAVVLLSSPLMPPGLQSTRVIRLIRLVRLVRLARAPTLIRDIFSAKGLEWAAFLTFIIVVGGGSAFTIVEKSQNLSSWDGIYWALSTVTTFGADVSPATNLGKVIAVTVLLVGTGFVAILTAAIAERFMRYAKANPDIATADAEVMAELQQISKRLETIERQLKK